MAQPSHQLPGMPLTVDALDKDMVLPETSPNQQHPSPKHSSKQHSLSGDDHVDHQSATHHQTDSLNPLTVAVPSQTKGYSDTYAPVASALTAEGINIRKPTEPSYQSLAQLQQYTDRSSALGLPLEPPKVEHRFNRPTDLDSPTLYDIPPLAHIESALSGAAEQVSVVERSAVRPTELARLGTLGDDGIASSIPNNTALAVESIPATALDGFQTSGADEISDQDSTYPDDIFDEPSPTPMIAPKPVPPHLKLDKVQGFAESDASAEETPTSQTAKTLLNKPLPKYPAPASPLAALFGWSNPSPSVTDASSVVSPVDQVSKGLGNEAATSLAGTSNALSARPLGYGDSSLDVSTAHIDDMEDELRAISSELAASIRREIDLEDLVDKLQEQVNNPHAPGKRTSDYFSDSGYSSTKQSEYDQTREEVDKIQRRSEQEKASLRLELTSKLQDERTRRKALDQQIKDLHEKTSQLDLAHINSLDANGRVRDLENTCEDLRRRLSEERQSKNNFEDLLGALKGELQGACNERDNLRDEVVPQLRARVEGLETEAAEYATLTYESTKMQQELQSLKQENQSLRNGTRPEDLPNRASLYSPGGMSKFDSAARGQKSNFFGLGRSNSIKNGQGESRELLAERLKDVEAQRDALHGALKNLLDRQEFQNRENVKKVKFLEAERIRLLSGEPEKGGFTKEIATLRTEINVLRRRAEEALEQKWQVEKGLSGLKMDLDRADEEIAALRKLLGEKDILIPPSLARSSGSNGVLGVPVTSESLRTAYKELQVAYNASVERIKKLELGSGPGSLGDKASLAMQRLEQSLRVAVSERDAVKEDSVTLKGRLNKLEAEAAQNVESERVLADELGESARQVEQLALQVQQQLTANAELRVRLSDTVSRGDSERKANYDRIAGLQERLHSLEENLITAQGASEDRVTRHEEEIVRLREAHNQQLKRVEAAARKTSLLRKSIPVRPPTIPNKSFEDEVEVKTLRSRVTELEQALAEAETEMQEVVTKMSTAQIEVMNLQEEREAAARETRRLQKMMQQEQTKTFEDRFKTLRGLV